MKILLKNKEEYLFSEIETLITLGAFSYLITDFSFSLLSVIVLKKRKINEQMINLILSNLIVLRFLLFLFSAFLIFAFLQFLKFDAVQTSYFICLAPLAAVIDLGWYYLIKDKFYLYFYLAILLKNLLFLVFIFLFEDVLHVYYIVGYVFFPLLINGILLMANPLRFVVNDVNLKYIRALFAKGLPIAMSDIVISTYSYLDVYFVVLLLSPLEATKYLVIRKIIKGINSLVGQLPKIILKSAVISRGKLSKMNLFYFLVVLLFFTIFNTTSEFMYVNVFNVGDFNLFWPSLLFSLLIILGPIQNLYSQVYVLKEGQSSLYLSSYLFGLLFFLVTIYTFNSIGNISLLIFISLRIFSDIFIIGYSKICFFLMKYK